MDALYYAGNLLVTFFDLYLCISFFNIFWKESKQGRPIRFLLCTVFLCGSMIPPFSGLWGRIMPVILIFIVSFYFKASLLNHLIFSLALLGIFVGCDGLASIILMLVRAESIQTIQGSLISYISGILLAKTLSLFLIRLVAMCWSKAHRQFRAVRELPLLLLPASSTLVLYALALLARNLREGYLFLFVLFSLVALVGANIYIIHLIERMAELQEKESRYILMQRIQQDQAAFYQTFIKSQRETREALHDYRNRMLSLEGLLRSGHIDAAAEHIRKDLEWMEDTKLIATGNEVLDAVINAKSLTMREESIQFSHTLLLPAHICADPVEFGIIIGDLLDNAIEACERIPPPDNRYILLELTQEGGYLVIRMENPLPPGERNRNDFRTSKESAGHGYGLESITKRAEKYGGATSFQRDSGRFIARVMLENTPDNLTSADFADQAPNFAKQ